MASVRKSIGQAYVLELKHIENLWSILQSRIGSPTIEIKCIDDINREFSSIKKFAEFENSKNKEITQLAIIARSDDFQKRATVTFNNTYGKDIDISIEATEIVLTRLYDDIRDVIGGLKPWYSFISKIDFSSVLMGAVVITSIFFMVYAEGTKDTEKIADTTLSVMEAAQITGILLLIVGGILFLVFKINHLRDRFFPQAYFAIGQGLKRYEVGEKIRWGVIISLIMSIIGSIFVTLIF